MMAYMCNAATVVSRVTTALTLMQEPLSWTPRAATTCAVCWSCLALCVSRYVGRCLAAATGNDDELTRLLRGVNDPNLADYDGRTALVPSRAFALVSSCTCPHLTAFAAPRCIRGPQSNRPPTAGCLCPRQRHRQIRRFVPLFHSPV